MPQYEPNGDYTGQNLSGKDLSGLDLRGAIFDRANLRGTTFDGANLREAQFERADLSQASLCGANLRYANLSHAILNRAILRFADLCKANLSDAELKYSNLENSKLFASTLPRAVFTGAWLRRADLSYADLSRANLEFADLIGAKLLETVLTFAKLNRSKLKQAHLRRANLIHAELRKCQLDYCVLERADLSHSILEGANLTRTNLTSAKLHKANLKDAILERTFLKNADLSEADLSGADLNEAILVDAILTGTNFSQTKFYKVNLSGSNIDGNDLSHTDLSDIDLSFAKLRRTDLTSSNLCRANLQGADLTGADLTGANLRTANLLGASLNGAQLTEVDLSDADLTLANIDNASLKGGILDNAQLLGACLYGTNLNNTNLTRTYLNFVKLDRNTNLDDANLRLTCFRGIACSEIDLSDLIHDGYNTICIINNQLYLSESLIEDSRVDVRDLVKDSGILLGIFEKQFLSFTKIHNRLLMLILESESSSTSSEFDNEIQDFKKYLDGGREIWQKNIKDSNIIYDTVFDKVIYDTVYDNDETSVLEKVEYIFDFCQKIINIIQKVNFKINEIRDELKTKSYQLSPKYNANPFHVNNHLEPFLIAAGSRAIESIRQDQLINDELALPLIGEKIRDFVRELYTDDNKPYIVIRTKYFDDFLANTLENHEANAIQVILLGSGLDTRPFRLRESLLTATIYELDKPDVIQKKVDRLADIRAYTPSHDLEENSNHHFIEEDLTSDTWIESLYAKGYSGSKISIWIIEGLFVHLESNEVCKLLQDIQSHSVRGSWIGADLIDQQALSRHQRENWKSGFDEPRQLFAQYSWGDIEIKTPDDESVNHGRYIPSEDSKDGRAFFVTARKI